MTLRISGILGAMLLLMPFGASAANLYFFPESAVKVAGTDFTVSVFVNSSEQAMNAVSGVIDFPVDRLRVVSLSKANSIVNVWVQEPSFSNQDGKIRFEGIALNPGFQGGTGRVLAITFRPTAAGSATLKFSSGAVLANDGEGTNILRTMGGANYTLKADAQAGFPEKKEEVAPVKTIGAPQVNSATHPDEDKWYNSKKLELSWDIPGGTDGVSYALDSSPTFQLVPQGKGLISNVQYDISKFKDGIWFFYLRFHNTSGWGPVAKRAIKMDFSPPTAPTLTRLDGDDMTNPRPVYTWESKDSSAGVARYEIKIADADWLKADPGENGFALPVQLPGERQLAVRAFDEAGNYSDAGTVFTVRAIESPQLADYSRSFVSPSEKFWAEGTAKKDDIVKVFLRRNEKEVVLEAKTDTEGKWRVEHEGKLGPGEWRMTLLAIDTRGGQSAETDAVTLNIISAWVRLAQAAGKILAIMGLFLVSLGVLLGLIYFTVGKSLLYRFRLRHDFSEFKSKVRTELKALEGDLESLKQNGKIDPNTPGFKEAEKRLKGELATLVEDVRREARNLE